MRSYYESFGQAVLSDSNGESEQLEESGCDVERERMPGLAASRVTPGTAVKGRGGSAAAEDLPQYGSRCGTDGPRTAPTWVRGMRGMRRRKETTGVGKDEVVAKDFATTRIGAGMAMEARRIGKLESQDHENWSWKTGCSCQGSLGEEALSHHWPKRQLKWEQQALYVEDEQAEKLYHPIPDGSEVLRDSKGTVKVVGEDDVLKYGEKKQSGGRVSSTYPPVFRARPQESYSEWKRSVEFWIGGEGGQLPPELIGPRMMVQLRDRAAQLVKRLSNKDVNGPDGKDIIFKELERSPLIRQVDKHKIDEHRRRLMHLNRAPHESIESYITRGPSCWAWIVPCLWARRSTWGICSTMPT